MTLSLSHFGSNVEGATHAGLGSNLVTKKGFSLFKWMLKKAQSVFIERNSLKIVVYAFKYLIAFGEMKAS